MRYASAISWIGGLVASLALLAIAVAAIGGWRVHRIPADLRLPLPSLHPPARHRSSGPPVTRQVSAELPAWFGDAGAAPVRVAGTVFGGRGAVTVRLAIDVPDPGIWTGRDAAVGADGAFDFGPMRPGRYLLVASGALLRSRVTPLDTISPLAGRAELYMYPCQSVTGLFTKPAVAGRAAARRVPAAGIALEIAGQVIGTTAADGSFDVCVLSRAELRLGVAGYESSGDAAASVGAWGLFQDLESEYVYTGTVIEGDGSPVRDVGVQPVWGEGDYCMDSSVVVTTDAAGRFRFGGRETICGIRILRGTTVYEAPYTAFQPTEPVVIAPPPPPIPLLLPYPSPPPLPPALEVPAIVPLSLDGGPAELTVQLATPIRKLLVGFGGDRARPLSDRRGAWIRGRVMAGDAPVGDAMVSLDLPIHLGTEHGWPRVATRSDGTFAMFVATPELDQPRVMLLDAETSSGALKGRVVLEIATGQSRDGVSIEVGPGAKLRGTVVDEVGRPFAGVQVGDAYDRVASSTTERDGSFSVTLPRQGRYRLRVFESERGQYAPLPGRVLPAIDVAHPAGDLARVRFVVRRSLFPSDDWSDPYLVDNAVFGMVDLGAVLDRDNVVVRIGDEAAAAGMRLHDEVIAADGMLPGVGLDAAFDTVPPGWELRWRVKRGGATLALHARAPWLGSAP